MSDEQQDDQQHQQNMFDALLVPIDEQVKIGLSNFRIALEKSQPDGKLQLMIYQDFPCFKFYKEWSQNDDINTFADYLEYLAKSLGTQPVEVKGHETSQSKEVDDTVDSEETKEEDEIPLVQRQTKVIIEVPDGLDLKGSNEGFGVTPTVLDVPSSSLSSSSLKSKIENISSDDENDGVKDKENAEEEKGDEEQHMDDVGGNEQVGDTQAKVHKSKPQIEKPEATIVSSSQTLSSGKYGNQFINDNPDVSLTDVLKEPVEAEVQSLVDVPVLQQKVVE
ncbi:hypothetical protein Tco_1503417 [Tanacetum coccineum]